MGNRTTNATIKRGAAALLATASLYLAGPACASPLLGQAPDPSLIVTVGGLDWVWASGCAATGGVCGEPIQHNDGFYIATRAQWNASFSSSAELLAAFTTPSGFRCAAAYFEPDYSPGVHDCSPTDVGAGFVWHAPFALLADIAPDLAYNNDFSDTFLVRQEVPEPGTLVLVAIGIAGLAARRRAKGKG
jgi:hypothetical protein